jgi:hypothetical protein
MDVQTAMLARRSVRAFEERQVPRETLTAIFDRAQRAPSWCNIQPWRVWLASGATRKKLIDGLVKAAGETMPSPDVPFPAEYPEPYGQHRRACGKALYSAMGVARDDGAGRHGAWMRNFVAFDAPHVAIIAMDKRFSIYGSLDLGCWLQSVMLLAIEEGVSTCAQASLSLYPDVCREVLGVTSDVQILCGLGLGYEAANIPANDCRTDRDPLEKNVVFCD